MLSGLKQKLQFSGVMIQALLNLLKILLHIFYLFYTSQTGSHNLSNKKLQWQLQCSRLKAL